MATYVTNRDGEGRTDEKGHFKFLASAFSGNVVGSTDMQVVQQVTPGMSVRVSEGDIRIPINNYAYMAWSEGYTGVSIATADPSNPRIDRIVAYIDTTMTFLDTDTNNPGALKFKAVTGTPNAVPSKASDAAAQASVGATNPWVEIATVAVAAAASSIVNANVTDTRVFATAKNAPNSITLAMMTDASIGTAELVNGSATTQKMKPTIMTVAGNNGGSRQFCTAQLTDYNIVGTDITYTSGPTNEWIHLSGSALINCQSASGGQFYIADNTTPISKTVFMQIANTYVTAVQDCFFQIAANTTKTFRLRYKSGSGSNTAGEICNSSGDQTAVPSFGVELRLIAFGRT